MFLSPADLVKLTGRKQRKLQIAQLRAMGIPFHVNAAGEPVVARAAIEGQTKQQSEKRWEPTWGASQARI